MKLHANARLSVKGRELLVDRVLAGDWSVSRGQQKLLASAIEWQRSGSLGPSGGLAPRGPLLGGARPSANAGSRGSS